MFPSRLTFLNDALSPLHFPLLIIKIVSFCRMAFYEARHGWGQRPASRKNSRASAESHLIIHCLVPNWGQNTSCSQPHLTYLVHVASYAETHHFEFQCYREEIWRMKVFQRKTVKTEIKMHTLRAKLHENVSTQTRISHKRETAPVKRLKDTSHASHHKHKP
eukprot:c25301_g3_i4 orf=404-889(-)